MRTALLALLVVGCSIPEKHFDNGAIDAPQGTIDSPQSTADSPFSFPDARPTIDGPFGTPDGGAPFGCMGQPFPTTAPATFTVSGQIARLDGGTLVGGATINGYPLGSSTPVITTSGDANGSWSVQINSGGQALAGYIKATAPGVIDSYVYPQAPIAGDATISIETFTSPISSIGLDPTMAQMLVQVHDCNGVALSGAVFSLVPATANIQYIKNGTTDPTATMTDSSGVALVLNYPPGNAELHAVVSGMQMRVHTFPVVANTMTTGDIQP